MRDHPDALFWRVFLDCEYARDITRDNITRDYLDFMPVEAVRQRIEYIQTFYQRQDEKVQAMYARPFIYLSQAEMDQFVQRATQQLAQIYQRLCQEKADTTGLSSVLELTWS